MKRIIILIMTTLSLANAIELKGLEGIWIEKDGDGVIIANSDNAYEFVTTIPARLFEKGFYEETNSVFKQIADVVADRDDVDYVIKGYGDRVVNTVKGSFDGQAVDLTVNMSISKDVLTVQMSQSGQEFNSTYIKTSAQTKDDVLDYLKEEELKIREQYLGDYVLIAAYDFTTTANFDPNQMKYTEATDILFNHIVDKCKNDPSSVKVLETGSTLSINETQLCLSADVNYDNRNYPSSAGCSYSKFTDEKEIVMHYEDHTVKDRVDGLVYMARSIGEDIVPREYSIITPTKSTLSIPSGMYKYSQQRENVQGNRNRAYAIHSSGRYDFKSDAFLYMKKEKASNICATILSEI